MSFIQPVQGRISSAFGVDRGDRNHNGIDIAAGCGTPVVAAESGQVSAANYSTSAGNLVHIEHGGGLQTRYFHLQRSVVGVGANVTRGQLIGYVGSTGNSTGCHLHWEARRNGVAVNPLTASGPGAGGGAAPSGGGSLPVAVGNYLPIGFDVPQFSNDGMILAGVGLFVLILILRR
jgi:murein DD-endopeptidase MepM/ murein hydrolase activator NlpD